MVPSVCPRRGQVVVGGSSNHFYFLRDFGLPQVTKHALTHYLCTHIHMYAAHKIYMVVPLDLPLQKAVQC